MRGLPHTYRDTKANDGTAIQITINGEAGGDWYLIRNQENWRLDKTPIGNPAVKVVIEPNVAWKLFTKGIEREFAIERIGK